ncbi:hypothetical protein [Halorussus halobius]|uniref:hypothetical protein n=1 Tax=Halorussus halobius TaxID=1710537 RepID=UPI001091E67D|nr:hypothetical protein [Halorussus halobius]
MSSTLSNALTDALHDAVGDGLRTVALVDVPDQEYELAHMRADIDEMYTGEMREDILEEVVFEHIAEARKEDLFPPLGGLEYTVRIYGKGINLVGWTRETAVFVGLDRDPELVPPAVSVCRREL